MRSPKRLPDFFALGVESGIVAPGIDMADEILMAGGLPTFSAVFGRFHGFTVELAIQILALEAIT